MNRITPNSDQAATIQYIIDFVRHPTRRQMLVRGSAGTGKTTCINF